MLSIDKRVKWSTPTKCVKKTFNNDFLHIQNVTYREIRGRRVVSIHLITFLELINLYNALTDSSLTRHNKKNNYCDTPCILSHCIPITRWHKTNARAHYNLLSSLVANISKYRFLMMKLIVLLFVRMQSFAFQLYCIPLFDKRVRAKNV